MYDQSKVDRLVAGKRERHPHGSQVELLRAAIASWERDPADARMAQIASYAQALRVGDAPNPGNALGPQL